MPANTVILSPWDLAKNSVAFQKVMAGDITIDEFANKHAYEFKSLQELMQAQYKSSTGDNEPLKNIDPLTIDGVTSAWIMKLRFNEDMGDQDFFTHIQRGAAIMRGDFLPLTLSTQAPEANDNISLMWAVQAAQGTQGFERGTTRIRLPPGVAKELYTAYENGGAQHRASTHAQLTRIESKGLGKDIVDASHRAHTPFGMGALLIVPTYQNTADAQAGKNMSTVSDHDLLMKMETWGLSDSLRHTIGHGTKVKFGDDAKYCGKKSPLAKACEKEHGVYGRVERKEHLSALPAADKNCLTAILQLAKSSNSTTLRGAFKDYQLRWSCRWEGLKTIKKILNGENWKEAKIAGADGKQLSLGAFLATVKDNEKSIIDNVTRRLSNINMLLESADSASQAQLLTEKAELIKIGTQMQTPSFQGIINFQDGVGVAVTGATTQAATAGFAACREGNEVMVDASSGQAKVERALFAQPVPTQKKQAAVVAPQATQTEVAKQVKASSAAVVHAAAANQLSKSHAPNKPQ